MKLSVIITAGGSSSRYGNTNKLLEKIHGKEVVLHSIEAFLPLNPFEIIISASESLMPAVSELVKNIPNIKVIIKVVQGGDTRQQSVFNALKACDNPDFVAIHDGARPLVKLEDIKKCIDKAIESKAAILSVKAVDTIKIVDSDNKIMETPDRNYLWCVQTPQIFDYKLILSVHEKLQGQNFSDDAGMLEAENIPVYVVEGSYSNIKITTKDDIAVAQAILE